MPGALKLSNLSIFHKHTKPYYYYYYLYTNTNNNNKFLLHSLSSSATTTTTTVKSSRPISNFCGARLRMTTPYAPVAAHSKFPPTTFRGPKSHLFSADSDSKAQSDRDLRSIDLDTRMRANGKVDNLSDDVVSQPPPQKLLTLPTILTLGRVAAVPLLVTTFYIDSWWGPTATTGIFLAAAITDWLDGYLARRMNLGTQFGAFLDPVADKLMVAATLILLCTKPFDAGMFGKAPWLLTLPAIAIIGREITMSAVREWAASQDKKLLEAVAVNNLGKWKTASQMVALSILLASRDSSFVVAGSLVSSGVVLLYISAWLALWSLVVYMRKIWKVLLR